MRLILGCFCLLVCLSACREKKKMLLELGVSRELAAERKSRIRDLHYQLVFHLPEDKNTPVEGQVKVSFSMQEPGEIILDFREKEEAVRSVRVNGKEIPREVIQEHIRIAGKYIRRGSNEIGICFVAGDRSLNRNEEYLYTLLVPDRARTLFPCFDQPDLKARFSLELDLPAAWEGIANAPVETEKTEKGRKRMVFAHTQPLSTYLFAFVAGRFERQQQTRKERTVTLYHRETDPDKVAQTGIIFNQVFASLDWLEEYTGIPYPFAKYDLVILPGFQFGGMEHPGAVLYNDKRMFLNAHPSLEEKLGRMELIAHETAHMWFGDAVTMAWFDDVWTKEVFANYFAERMTRPQFPGVNHELKALRSFPVAAYREDRTAGTNAIRQELGNLNEAGLVYGQIVYNKAPVVMNMLVELMGEAAFRSGIQEYLRTYAYGNATWDELIRILDRYTPEDLAGWSKAWVSEKGMPEVYAGREGERWVIRQCDPWGRGLVWPQKQSLRMVGKEGLTAVRTLEVFLKDSLLYPGIPADVEYLLPNADGKGYGYFVLDEETAAFCLGALEQLQDPVLRLSVGMTLHENYLHDRIAAGTYVKALSEVLPVEKEALISSAWIGYLKEVALHGSRENWEQVEQVLYQLVTVARYAECRQQAFRALAEIFISPACTDFLYRIWEKQRPVEGVQLGEGDYMKLAYELALRCPERYAALVEKQAERLKNPDRKREFLFVSRAVTPEPEGCDTLFASLLDPAHRQVEPWVAQVMYYLHHPLRRARALKYIRPALEELQEVQRTGDIFFPKNWVDACLRGHNSREAAAIVREFLATHPDYPPLLKNKILQSAGHLPDSKMLLP